MPILCDDDEKSREFVTMHGIELKGKLQRDALRSCCGDLDKETVLWRWNPGVIEDFRKTERGSLIINDGSILSQGARRQKQPLFFTIQ